MRSLSCPSVRVALDSTTFFSQLIQWGSWGFSHCLLMGSN
jgi:hypothetical protein